MSASAGVFGTLGGLRERSIIGVSAARQRRMGYRTHPIDAVSPYFGEPLVEAAEFGLAGQNYYYATHNPPYWGRLEGATPRLRLRHSVGEKLARVNARLREAGLELFIFDAFRPRALQAYIHDVWMPLALTRRDPTLSADALRAEVERYWAAPSDSRAPAPHATGAAVDLTLRWLNGEILWMGSILDDVTALAHRDQFETPGSSTLCFSDEEARANRRLLHWVMVDEGFAGHPDEWWHYSWGDQLWARLTGAPAAHYGWAGDE